MVTLVFAAVTVAFLGTITVAMLAARAAHNATKRADQAVAEAALATKEAYRARADLHKVTRLLLAEVKRAEDARNATKLLRVVPAVLPAFRERDLTEPKGERVAPFPVLADGTKSLAELAGACGQYASGLPIGFGQVEQIITQFYEGRG